MRAEGLEPPRRDAAITGAMANGAADGDEKSEDDGPHAVECAATINRRKRLDDLGDGRSFLGGQETGS